VADEMRLDLEGRKQCAIGTRATPVAESPMP
jgi:hypothetical protein